MGLILNALENINNCYVYRHIRLDTNEVFYIGKGSHQKKWKYERSLTKKNRNNYWKNIVKLNNDRFKVDILFDNITIEEANSKEIEFIKLYGRKDLGSGTLCNLTDGGDGGRISEETKKKIGNANRGVKSFMFGKKHTQEWKDLMKDKMSGINNPNYNKPLSEIQKQINRKAQLGRIHSPETIELRVSQIRKKVIDTSTGNIYISIEMAAKFLNISGQHLGKMLSGKKNNNTTYKLYI